MVRKQGEPQTEGKYQARQQKKRNGVSEIVQKPFRRFVSFNVCVSVCSYIHDVTTIFEPFCRRILLLFTSYVTATCKVFFVAFVRLYVGLLFGVVVVICTFLEKHFKVVLSLCKKQF